MAYGIGRMAKETDSRLFLGTEQRDRSVNFAKLSSSVFISLANIPGW